MLIPVLSVFLSPQIVYAVDVQTAIAAYKYFDDVENLGTLACVAHLGPDQCRRPDRCAELIGYVKALRSGLPSAALKLDEEMNRSGLRRNCGYSLLGGNTGALFRNFTYLADYAKQQGSQADSRLAAVAAKEFLWSYAGPIMGMRCVNIDEASQGNDGSTHTWGDNWLCSEQDHGIRYNAAGAISGMRCTQMHESASPHTWGDNYVCIPPSSSLNLAWSSAGQIAGKECVQILEPADPHTWDDNFLCY